MFQVGRTVNSEQLLALHAVATKLFLLPIPFNIYQNARSLTSSRPDEKRTSTTRSPFLPSRVQLHPQRLQRFYDSILSPALCQDWPPGQIFALPHPLEEKSPERCKGVNNHQKIIKISHENVTLTIMQQHCAQHRITPWTGSYLHLSAYNIRFQDVLNRQPQARKAQVYITVSFTLFYTAYCLLYMITCLTLPYTITVRCFLLPSILSHLCIMSRCRIVQSDAANADSRVSIQPLSPSSTPSPLSPKD